MSEPASLRAWLAEPLSSEAKKQVERARTLPDAVAVRVMPDAHAGEQVCNGCVLATTRLVYPMAVGGDIGCGFAAAPLGAAADAFTGDRGEAALRAIGSAVPIIRHRGRTAPSPDLDASDLSDAVLRKAALKDGLAEHGTLGRGNHFVEIARDEDGRAWLMVHSGSRVLGQIITAHHLRRAGKAEALDTSEDAGRAYMLDAAWAVRWASSSRLAMLRACAAALRRIVSCEIDKAGVLDAPHNTVEAETHDCRVLLVHRKGANAAHADRAVIIAGSAGTFSVLGTGRGCAEALHSCSHGAGRRLSRGEGGRAFSARDVASQLRGVVFDKRLAAKLTPETPGVYRDMRRVMEAQRDLVRIRERLTPLVSFKGV